MGKPSHRELWKQHIAYAVTKLTLDVVSKLEQAFSIGATIEESCDYADVSPNTYYRWIKKYPELCERFERVRQRLPLKAKQNIATTIHNGDLAFSKWLVEKYQPEKYGDKIKVQHEGEVPVSAEGLLPEERELYQDYIKRRRELRQRRAIEEDKKSSEKK